MEEAAFSAIVQEHTRLVFTVCYRLVQDYQEAENLTQETFLTAYRAIDRFEGTRYKPWLVRIAANKAKDYLKSAARRTTVPADTERMEAVPAPDPLYSPLESAEGLKAIEEACTGLPPPYGEVARLFFIEEKSCEEIAVLLGRPVKTVRTQQARAREKLRKLLKDKEREEWACVR